MLVLYYLLIVVLMEIGSYGDLKKFVRLFKLTVNRTERV